MEGLELNIYQENKESRKVLLSKRLSEIIQRDLTVENIDSYVELALSELIDLISDAVEDYRREVPTDVSVGRDLEDNTFQYFELQDIQEVLRIVSEKAAQIKETEIFIEHRLGLIQEVTTPPDASEVFAVSGSEYPEQFKAA